MVYVIQVCRQLSSSRIRMDLQFHPDPAARKLSVWHIIADCTANNSWWWTEELSETWRVSFQNKFEKLGHLVAFIIRKLMSPFPLQNVRISPNSTFTWISDFIVINRYIIFIITVIIQRPVPHLLIPNQTNYTHPFTYDFLFLILTHACNLQTSADS
jgi:hypothetical protein